MNLKQRNGKILQAMLNFKIQHVLMDLLAVFMS